MNYKSNNVNNISNENNVIYINAWVNYFNNKLKPRNFGDDINFSFLS
jgi:hypothetical protein